MTVTARELAPVMFRARCQAIGMSEEDVWDITGDGPEQFLDLAEEVAKFINEREPESRAIARYLLDRDKVSSLFQETPIDSLISTGPCYRVLP